MVGSLILELTVRAEGAINHDNSGSTFLSSLSELRKDG